MKDFSFPDSILIDRGTQPRCEINDETVGEYKRAMLAGDKFPPMVVFHDGVNYYLADGFHRYFAYVACEGTVPFPPPIKFVRGTHRDAQLYACGANHDHGLRRTNADKQKIVDFLLRDEEWGQWSDRTIAEHAKVSHTMVSKWRSQLGRYERKNEARRNARSGASGSSCQIEPAEPRVVKVKRGSSEYAMKVAAPEEPGPPMDKEGQPITESRIADLFERRDLDDDMATLSAMRSRLDKVDSDPLYTHANVPAIRKALKDAYDMLKAARPHTVTPKGLDQRWTDIGWLTEAQYKRLPQEKRHG